MRNIDSKSRPRMQFRFKYLAVRIRLLRLGGSLTTFSTVSTHSGHPRGVELSTFNPVPSLTKACLKPPTTGIQIVRVPRRGTAMIRTTVLRALVLTAAFAAALTPVTCLGENSNRLPTEATKKLPPELLSLLRQKKMPIRSPILVRVFKEEAELEVWKQDTTGRFQILKTYPICRWSGDLGPKLQEGDRQTPEGF